MDVRIGVIQTAREISLEMADDTDRDKLRADVESAIAKGDGVLWLSDRKGKTVGVAVAKIAYVELVADEKRKLGFGA
jgi:Protein of unknown function (DUF3107)